MLPSPDLEDDIFGPDSSSGRISFRWLSTDLYYPIDLERIRRDRSTDQEEVTWDSILRHIELSMDIDSLSAFQGWLAPHLHDVLYYLQDLIPLNIRLDVLYERNDFAGAKELTRHLQLRGHDRELMMEFRAFLYERRCESSSYLGCTFL